MERGIFDNAMRAQMRWATAHCFHEIILRHTCILVAVTRDIFRCTMEAALFNEAEVIRGGANLSHPRTKRILVSVSQPFNSCPKIGWESGKNALKTILFLRDFLNGLFNFLLFSH